MITQIHIPDDIANRFGLKPASFRRLGQVVTLAGPNGAGKSRYLQAVAATLEATIAARRNLPSTLTAITEHKRERELATEYLVALENSETPSPLHPGEPGSDEHRALDRFMRDLEVARNRVTQLVSSSEALERQHRDIQTTVALASLSNSELDVGGSGFVLLGHPGADSEVKNARDMKPKDADRVRKRLHSGGLASSHEGMHVYFESIARTLFFAKHTDTFRNEALAEGAERFNDLLEALVGARIEPQVNDTNIVPFWRGRPFRSSELSKGERVLASWAITIHMQQSSLTDTVLLIDEPENHLHPAACIQALNKLRGLLGAHGQIWLATHSVPLLAYGGTESLFLVRNNSAEQAAKTTDAVVESLLGGANGRLQLQQFLSDADQMSASQYFAECLFERPAIDTSQSDPQKSMFLSTLARARATSRALKVLDFGAGRGRLAASLADLGSTEALVSYYAYVPAQHSDHDERESCRIKIAALQQEHSIDHYFWDNADDLAATMPSTFDMVVMSNVLHEISPLKWLETITTVDQLLAPDGLLIVMEDLVPRFGELPHLGGHIVLNKFALRRLFSADQRVGDAVAPLRDGRLVAIEVPKLFLKNANPATRIAALEYVVDRAKSEIERLRQLPVSSRTADTGREHAHYVVQFANASLALRELNPQQMPSRQDPGPGEVLPAGDSVTSATPATEHVYDPR